MVVCVSATRYNAAGHQLIILPVFAQTSNTDRHARTSPAYQSDRSSSPPSNFARAVPPLMPRSHLSGFSFWSSGHYLLLFIIPVAYLICDTHTDTAHRTYL